MSGRGVRVALSKPRAQRAISREVASAVAQAPSAYRTSRDLPREVAATFSMRARSPSTRGAYRPKALGALRSHIPVVHVSAARMASTSSQRLRCGGSIPSRTPTSPFGCDCGTATTTAASLQRRPVKAIPLDPVRLSHVLDVCIAKHASLPSLDSPEISSHVRPLLVPSGPATCCALRAVTKVEISLTK